MCFGVEVGQRGDRSLRSCDAPHSSPQVFIRTLYSPSLTTSSSINPPTSHLPGNSVGNGCTSISRRTYLQSSVNLRLSAVYIEFTGS